MRMRPNESVDYIYTPYITINGRRVYARQYGLRAFRIKVRHKD